jgi:hypothetical protein
MDLAIVKVDDKPMSMWYSPHREKFGNQRLHYLIDEILAIENALRGHQICHVKTRSLAIVSISATPDRLIQSGYFQEQSVLEKNLPLSTIFSSQITAWRDCARLFKSWRDTHLLSSMIIPAPALPLLELRQ